MAGRRVSRRLREGVRIDSRTLAVFRVGVSLLVLADLLARSRNFGFFYTEDGVVPQSLAMAGSPDYAVSVYYLTTSSTAIAALFVLQGVFAVQLLVGYRTRLATVLTFLGVVSLDFHNPYVLSYADTLFRLLLFWAIFLPLGERWSVDAVHRAREAGLGGAEPSVARGAESPVGRNSEPSVAQGAKPPVARESVASVASALILGQMVFMYFSNGLIKSQSALWGSGDTAPLVMGLDEMTFLLGDVAREVPTLLSIGGLTWYYMLLLSPLLILLRGRARMALVGLFVGGHLSFAVTVRIGAFAYVALAGVLLFLQGQFWRDAARVATRIGIDVSGLRRRVVPPLERLAAGVPAHRPGDLVLDRDRVDRIRARTHAASLAVVVLAICLVAGVLAVNVLPVALAGDAGDEPLEERVEAEIEATMDDSPGAAEVETVAAAVGVDQPIGWGVFAGPGPRTTDRYYVAPAETADGEVVDAFNDRPMTFERPGQELQQQHGTYRERFYMNSVRRGGFGSDVTAAYAEHVCDTWGDADDELVALAIYEVTEAVTLETIDAPEDRDRDYSLVSRHGCGDHEPREIQPPPE